MNVGDKVWTASWGTVRHGKLLAIDGDQCAVRREGGEIHGEILDKVFATRAEATAAALIKRKADLKDNIRKLSEAMQAAQKTLDLCLESIEAIDSEE